MGKKCALITGIELLLIEARIKIGDGLFAVAFNCCLVISPKKSARNLSSGI